jgi:hypothetical protein
VKASLRFRGRQMAHRELGYAIINRLIQDIGDAGMVEFMPRMEGRHDPARHSCAGGEAAPYDLKIVPPVDESKEKDAIPPPGAEKSADKKPEERPDPQKNGCNARNCRARCLSGFALSEPTEGGWRCGRAIRKRPARRSRATRRPMLPG